MVSTWLLGLCGTVSVAERRILGSGLRTSQGWELHLHGGVASLRLVPLPLLCAAHAPGLIAIARIKQKMLDTRRISYYNRTV